MNWNILDASFIPTSSYSHSLYYTERNDNCMFYAWECSFWVPTHIFIQHIVFMAVLFDWILGWCQFTSAVPIHPGLSWILFSLINQKWEYLKFLRCIWVELLCKALRHICYNLLAVSMTLLETIKKRGANSPRSPLNHSWDKYLSQAIVNSIFKNTFHIKHYFGCQIHRGYEKYMGFLLIKKKISAK